MAYLVITLDGKTLGRHELRGEAVIGRSTDCDVWINDLGVSRRHAKIELRPDGRWFVYDLKSRNGVFLRDVAVNDQILSDGDVLKIGPARIMFHEVGTYNARPDDPTDSIADQILAELEGTKSPGDDDEGTRDFRRPLPQAKATVAKAPAPIYIHESELTIAEPGRETQTAKPTPLAFKRPPAKPIIERSDRGRSAP